MDMDRVLQGIIEAVSHKLGDRNLVCQLCSGDKWLPPLIVAPLQVAFQDGHTFEPMFTNQVVPMAILVCDQCGYSISVNLVKLGLWAKWNNASKLVVPGGSGSSYLEKTISQNGSLG